MAKIEDLLPVGSVVRLTEGQKKLMVIGIVQTDENNKDHDYLGVIWPEGYISNKHLYMFEHEDIVEIICRGHEGPERDQFVRWLSEQCKGQSKAPAKKGLFAKLFRK